MAKAAFIGLGVMGYPMAGHLAKAGHDMTVYNRTSEKAAKWVGRAWRQARGNARRGRGRLRFRLRLRRQ